MIIGSCPRRGRDANAIHGSTELTRLASRVVEKIQGTGCQAHSSQAGGDGDTRVHYDRDRDLDRNRE
jgi:hypothetical protein